LVDVREKTIAERVRELAKEHPDAYLVDPSEDAFGIKGISSLGRELGSLKWKFDMIVAPIGGGALASGVILGLKEARSRSLVIGAEPALANDAARSLKEGEIVSNEKEPRTIADEARAMCLGQSAWSILCRSLSGIVEIPEEKITDAMRLLFDLANLKVEPSGALSVAALLAEPELFHGRSVCCIVSGGNVDQGLYKTILQGQ
jgi:threonine dehydratase